MDILKKALPIYAAVVATASVGWNIYNEVFRNTRALRVVASLEVDARKFDGHIYSPDAPMEIEEHFFDEGRAHGRAGNSQRIFLHARNVGRRPITIQAWKILGMMFTSSNSTHAIDPVLLPESGTFRVQLDAMDDLRSNAQGVAFIDSHGKQWPLPQKQWNLLRDAMLRYKL